MDLSKYKGWTREGADPHIIINNATTLTRKQHVEVLKRILMTIATKPLSKVNSDALGDKYTSCNWGMCSDRVEHYPSAELHTFPFAFDERQRVSALRGHPKHDCPIRERSPDDTDSERNSGCFYQCRVFQRNRKTPSRIEAIDLYHAAIEKLDQEIDADERP